MLHHCKTQEFILLILIDFFALLWWNNNPILFLFPGIRRALCKPGATPLLPREIFTWSSWTVQVHVVLVEKPNVWNDRAWEKWQVWYNKTGRRKFGHLLLSPLVWVNLQYHCIYCACKYKYHAISWIQLCYVISAYSIYIIHVYPHGWLLCFPVGIMHHAFMLEGFAIEAVSRKSGGNSMRYKQMIKKAFMSSKEPHPLVLSTTVRFLSPCYYLGNYTAK